MDTDACCAEDAQNSPHSGTHQSELSRRDYLHGVALLLIVVFLWTASNFITQDIFEDGYEKPFLITYLNTSSFAFYLIPWAARSFLLRKTQHANDHSRVGYEAVAVLESLEAPTSALISNFRAPSVCTEGIGTVEELDPLTTRETAQLASVFCLFWFIANWSINASLQFTSVASATVLSSTSGFFTLVVGRIFKVESLTVAKFLAVATSFFGVTLVSTSDSTSTSRDDPTVSIFARALHPSPVLGDVLALLGALFYALYMILLKIRIKEESRIDMQLFFGFVGLFNVVMLWPIAIILHFTGVEILSAPPTGSAWVAILMNMFITLSSDYIYVLAMLKTTPLLVTVGLSLTIPLALIGDFFIKKPAAPLAVLGAVLVLGAFVLVGVENAKDSTRGKRRLDGSFEVEEVEPILDPAVRS